MQHPNVSLTANFHDSVSLCASLTLFFELKCPVELKSFSDANRVCKPANESMFLVMCRFRNNTELFPSGNNQSIVLRSALWFLLYPNCKFKSSKKKMASQDDGLFTIKNTSESESEFCGTCM